MIPGLYSRAGTSLKFVHILYHDPNPFRPVPTGRQWPFPKIVIFPHGIWTLDILPQSSGCPSCKERQWFRTPRRRIGLGCSLELEVHFRPVSRNTIEKKETLKEKSIKKRGFCEIQPIVEMRTSAFCRSFHHVNKSAEQNVSQNVLTCQQRFYRFFFPHQQRVPQKFLPRQQGFRRNLCHVNKVFGGSFATTAKGSIETSATSASPRNKFSLGTFTALV